MKRTWILVANSARARCFECSADRGGLDLLSSFECPQARAKGGQLTSDQVGYEEMIGHWRGSTSLGQRASPRTLVRDVFARDLARFLSAGIAAQRCSALVILASLPFLGRIKAHLSPSAEKALMSAIGRDMTGLDPSAVAERIRGEVRRAQLH
jgi:protein required for attachment to host cells